MNAPLSSTKGFSDVAREAACQLPRRIALGRDHLSGLRDPDQLRAKTGRPTCRAKACCANGARARDRCRVDGLPHQIAVALTGHWRCRRRRRTRRPGGATATNHGAAAQLQPKAVLAASEMIVDGSISSAPSVSRWNVSMSAGRPSKKP